jgi:zinc protease
MSETRGVPRVPGCRGAGVPKCRSARAHSRLSAPDSRLRGRLESRLPTPGSRERPRVFRALTAAAAALAVGTVGLGAQPRPDRSAPPSLGPAPSLTLPAIQKHTLSNGLQVWVVEQHEVPIVQVNLVLRTGSSADPFGRFGLASLTATMVMEGAAGRGALELADAFDVLGVQIATASTFDVSAIRLSVPVAQLSEALPLVADVVVRPDFPAEELERRRQERLTAFLQARDDPVSIAQTAFPRLLFGIEHRYGTPAAGTETALKALTVDDLRGFHRTHYRPDNAVLIVVGDVTAAEALPAVERHLGSWRADAAAPAPATVPAARQHGRRQVYLIDKPGAAQSQVRIGWVGVPRSTPDYFPLVVMNTILGGSFTSRLNTNLRETHGYSYGASSVFDMRRAPGPFFAGAGVQTDKTAEALTEFFVELNGILKPMTAEELDKARNYVALGFPRDFETTGDLARRLEELFVFDLPEDYFARFVERVQAVTLDDVARVAKTYIQPANFAVVVVGDLKEIEAPVRKLNLGNVRVVPLDEVFRE